MSDESLLRHTPEKFPFSKIKFRQELYKTIFQTDFITACD